MNKKAFSISRLFKSFGYAFNGIWSMICQEQNAKIHLAVSILVIGAGFYFKISSLEWAAIVVMIGTVLAAEAINTSIEDLCDFISTDYNNKIKRIKDLAAGAVLIVALASVVIGLIIFYPKLIMLVR